MRFLLLIATSAIMAFGACKKKKPAESVKDHPVPSVPVEINVFPNDPINFKLQNPGGWIYVEGGINGIVLYRKSEEEFVAVERTSSHLPDDPKAKAWVMSDNFNLRDTVSGSRWRIFDGTVVEGPAEWPLRLYGTSYNGTSVRIVN